MSVTLTHKPIHEFSPFTLTIDVDNRDDLIVLDLFFSKINHLGNLNTEILKQIHEELRKELRHQEWIQ